MSFRLEAHSVSKSYGHQNLFKGISMQLDAPDSLAILGSNGSGKSTLLQLLAGYVSPDGGSINYLKNQHTLQAEKHFSCLSIAAPYIEIPESLTALELLNFHFSLRPAVREFSAEEMLQWIGLTASTGKQIRYFSSGMKQRLKLALAIFSDTPLLFLDEPCTNLDLQGIQIYKSLIREFASERIVVVASNMPEEYEFCKKEISLSVN